MPSGLSPTALTPFYCVQLHIKDQFAGWKPSANWFLPISERSRNPQLGRDQGPPLFSDAADVSPFNREALITALRTDQAGKSTFPEFLLVCWRAGVVRYDVDFTSRTVAYYGCQGE